MKLAKKELIRTKGGSLEKVGEFSNFIGEKEIILQLGNFWIKIFY